MLLFQSLFAVCMLQLLTARNCTHQDEEYEPGTTIGGGQFIKKCYSNGQVKFWGCKIGGKPVKAGRTRNEYNSRDKKSGCVMKCSLRRSMIQMECIQCIIKGRRVPVGKRIIDIRNKKKKDGFVKECVRDKNGNVQTKLFGCVINGKLAKAGSRKVLYDNKGFGKVTFVPTKE